MRLAAPEHLQCDSALFLARAVVLVVLMIAASIFPARVLAQGETTSAIVGEVADATGAVVPGATITITNQETGLNEAPRPMTPDASTFPS